MTEIANFRNGLGRALPASVLLHVLAVVLAVFAAMPGPAAAPPVIDLTLSAPPGAEGNSVPARVRTVRTATAGRTAAPLPTPFPQPPPRVLPTEPDRAPIAPAAGIPAPAVLEGSRREPSPAGGPAAVARPAAGVFAASAAPPPAPDASGGGGPASGSGRAIALERDYRYLKDSIQRRISYPPVARRMGWEGDVVVSFRIRPDGSAGDIRVVRGSGFPVLDRNAVEAVRSASPFRTPPAEAEIVTPVVYRLTPR